MPSAEFQIVPIDSITVLREKRQRRELRGIEELARSIRDRGLIHPPVIRRDNSELVAGERRLAACLSLGWSHIPVQFTDQIEPGELRLIELEENTKREDIPWQEQCFAIEEYHSIRREQNKDHSQFQTALELNLSQMEVSEKLRVAAELQNPVSPVAKVDEYSKARRIIRNTDLRKDSQAIEDLRRDIGGETAPGSVICADFNEWAQTYDGPKFNFIHCDFPYGIGADKHVQGAAKIHGGYSDDPSTYWDLCRTLSSSIPRLCTDSCHFMFWFSMRWYEKTLKFFDTQTPIVFDIFPLIWLKSDNSGIIPDPNRGPRRIYETCLFGSIGDRPVIKSVSNAYAAPSDRSSHMSIKPEPMLRYFFEMFVDSQTLMLDPTCGSGGSLRAAESLGAKHVIGVEGNRQFADDAQRSLTQARSLREAKT